jgi:DNA modification methylase
MTEPYYQDDLVQLFHGDCLEVMAELPDASVDAVVTDPPYGLEFMGKDWDKFKTGRGERYASAGGMSKGGFAEGNGYAKRDTPSYVNRPAKRCSNCGKQAWSGSPCVCPEPMWVMDNSPLHSFQDWCQAWAEQCLRILKPGGHLLAFGGTRTWHRLTCAIEDAGFEIRDSIAWLYGSGFPKSLDVSKAIDKAAGAEREVVGQGPYAGRRPRGIAQGSTFADDAYEWGAGHDITAPATDAARQWQGFGTALKPAFEPIVVARKPLTGTVAANVMQHGTGALNIDGCRIESGSDYHSLQVTQGGRKINGGNYNSREGDPRRTSFTPSSGRWPANVVLDETQAEALDQMSGELVSGGAYGDRTTPKFANVYSPMHSVIDEDKARDSGGASRFFYTAKADSGERITHNGVAHPTVKPLSLMRWLVRLVTQPGGLILEPFAGSGTTVEAALLEGFRCVAIEREADYLPLITQRIHRRRDPIAYLTEGGHDLGLFDDESA